jgi:hypothetical protein
MLNMSIAKILVLFFISKGLILSIILSFSYHGYPLSDKGGGFLNFPSLLRIFITN